MESQITNKSYTWPMKYYWSLIASTTINSNAELDYQPPKRNICEKSKTWRSVNLGKQRIKVSQAEKNEKVVQKDNYGDQIQNYIINEP